MICGSDVNFLDLGKTKTIENYIFLIALNTMYAPLDHDAGIQGISI